MTFIRGVRGGFARESRRTEPRCQRVLYGSSAGAGLSAAGAGEVGFGRTGFFAGLTTGAGASAETAARLIAGSTEAEAGAGGAGGGDADAPLVADVAGGSFEGAAAT